MQRKLEAVEAMVCSKDAQVSMLQETLRHAEDNFNAALSRVQELEQELCNRHTPRSPGSELGDPESCARMRSKSMPFLG